MTLTISTSTEVEGDIPSWSITGQCNKVDEIEQYMQTERDKGYICELNNVETRSDKCSFKILKKKLEASFFEMGIFFTLLFFLAISLRY
jgi:hypothetical protein